MPFAFFIFAWRDLTPSEIIIESFGTLKLFYFFDKVISIFYV